MAPNTFAKVSTSLGDEMLMLAGLSGNEALGRPFEYELDLFSLDGEIALTDIIGQSVTVQIELPENKYRFINGIATRFACVGGSGRYTVYRATLRPWFWLLTRTTDCRIFQDETVPDVIMKVFRLHGFTDFDRNFSRPYRKWEYIVQYRESSFNFVSRLMEQEGIYYYFKHEDGKHTLYMTDYYSGHRPQEGYEEIPFHPPVAGAQHLSDHIDGWRVTQEIQPGRFALNEFDFKKPKAELLTALNAQENQSDHEVYDYPGEYEDLADGEVYNRVRMEQASSQYEIVEGQGNARGLLVGNHFVLTEFPRKDQNREYLVTSATYSLDTGEFESTHRTGPKVNYRCAFQALETNTPFRPARETPKPEISGPQTAMVVGAAGDEIHTDAYGRVKLKFHWDRAPEKNETSSCWVRVAQVWAGTNWGAMHIPRVGQEVIVEFLEGDPDRPIITGRVYNANSMPPYTLPANKTQSGIKSRSSKGGNANNFNELRFEDKKGQEEVYVQAEKDMNILVKHDESRKVENDRFKNVTRNETVEIGVDRSEKVGQNETIKIGGTRNEDVTLDEIISIHGNRSEDVSLTESVTVGLARTHTIGGADTLLVGGVHTITVGGAQALSVGGVQAFSVAGNQGFNVGGSQSHSIARDVTVSTGGAYHLTVAKDANEKVAGARAQSVSKDDSLTVGKKLVISAADEIVLKTGSSSITMKKNGEIVISGKDITIKGSGKVKVNADSNLVIKGQKISEN